MDEIIEEMIKLYREQYIPLKPKDIALDVVDNMVAQNLLSGDEVDVAFPGIINRIKDML